MFPRLPARATFCGYKFCVRDTKNVSDFVQKHFVSATNVSQFAKPKKHKRQQCVRNDVSSFTRAFRISYSKAEHSLVQTSINCGFFLRLVEHSNPHLTPYCLLEDPKYRVGLPSATSFMFYFMFYVFCLYFMLYFISYSTFHGCNRR